MDGEKDLELIDRFLNSELSLQESEDFNLRLVNDPSFKELYQFINDLRVVTKVKRREEINEAVNEVFQQPVIKSTQRSHISLLKSMFEPFSQHPVYSIAATALILIISSVLIMVLVRKSSDTENIALQKVEQEKISQSDSLILCSKKLISSKFLPTHVISNDFGFVSSESGKTSVLNITIINDRKHTGKFILYSDTIILLGNYEIKNLKKVFNTPRFYFMNYSEGYYRLQKTEREILPVQEVNDSIIINALLHSR